MTKKFIFRRSSQLSNKQPAPCGPKTATTVLLANRNVISTAGLLFYIQYMINNTIQVWKASDVRSAVRYGRHNRLLQRSLQLICRSKQHYGKRQATFLYFALRLQPLDTDRLCCAVQQLTIPATANREAGIPNVLDSYLVRDIKAACQPADILRSVHVTVRLILHEHSKRGV